MIAFINELQNEINTLDDKSAILKQQIDAIKNKGLSEDNERLKMHMELIK